MSFIPKDNKLVLFSAWFGKKYADSSMYEYEYLLKSNNYKVIWYTVDKNIYNELNRLGSPVVLGNTLKGIWKQIRAKILVTSVQLSDFDIMFLRGTILLDLDHGFPIKQGGFNISGTSKTWILFQRLLRLGIDYKSTASSDYCCDIICKDFLRTPKDVVFVNKPRIDVLFDKTLQQGKNKKVEDLKKLYKLFIWMPTHRSCGEEIIDVPKILDLNKIQKVCEVNNAAFIIKKHFYHRNELTDTSNYPNIFDFTSENLDVQVLIAQADVLISDYSASYIDFLCLDRPIILFTYDSEKYLQRERGLYIPLEENTAGEIVTDSIQLCKSIQRICDDPYDNQFAQGRIKERRRFFDKDIEIGTSREKVKEIIERLCLGKNPLTWQDIRSERK